MRIGDVLLIDEHACIIISDPRKNPDQVVLTALTTHESYKDDSCLLDVGDHPFITRLTSVSYDFLPDTTTVARPGKRNQGRQDPATGGRGSRST